MNGRTEDPAGTDVQSLADLPRPRIEGATLAECADTLVGDFVTLFPRLVPSETPQREGMERLFRFVAQATPNGAEIALWESGGGLLLLHARYQTPHGPLYLCAGWDSVRVYLAPAEALEDCAAAVWELCGEDAELLLADAEFDDDGAPAPLQ